MTMNEMWELLSKSNSPVLVIDETKTYKRILSESQLAVHAYDRTSWVFVARMNNLFIPRQTLNDFDRPSFRTQMTYVELKNFAAKMGVGLHRKDWKIWGGNAEKMNFFREKMG